MSEEVNKEIDTAADGALSEQELSESAGGIGMLLPAVQKARATEEPAAAKTEQTRQSSVVVDL